MRTQFVQQPWVFVDQSYRTRTRGLQINPRSRTNRTTNQRAAHAHEQRLSIQQREFFVDWILEE